MCSLLRKYPKASLPKKQVFILNSLLNLLNIYEDQMGAVNTEQQWVMCFSHRAAVKAHLHTVMANGHVQDVLK